MFTEFELELLGPWIYFSIFMSMVILVLSIALCTVSKKYSNARKAYQSVVIKKVRNIIFFLIKELDSCVPDFSDSTVRSEVLSELDVLSTNSDSEKIIEVYYQIIKKLFESCEWEDLNNVNFVRKKVLKFCTYASYLIDEHCDWKYKMSSIVPYETIGTGGLYTQESFIRHLIKSLSKRSS